MKIEFGDNEVKAILEEAVRKMFTVGPNKFVKAESKSYHGIDAVVHITAKDDKPAQEEGE